MASLARELRTDLGNKVREARRIAEDGARKVIESLAVHNHEPWSSMSPEDRKLRNRLRAHGRQLGDQLDSRRGTQSIDHLVSEVAYEHWHGMLFARFLAENDLLLMPNTTTAITLDEIGEIARDEGRDWLTVVSEYAEKMLPQIFRSGDPALEVVLPPETRKGLETIIRNLDTQVFTADDSLGWTYQFWQADRKDEINNSGIKIGADELPAVTQLFTEDYMVLFLLHNTLGAWWAGKILAAHPELATSAKSEDELRAACKVGDVEWTYLRFVRDGTADGVEGQWRPAAGTFEGWPKAAKDITVLDPCMGSGHFLVFALLILVALRMADEGLSREAAVESVLRDNLFGLEIDSRCTQIAAFNLAFAAWRMVGYRPLPRVNLACSGLAIGVTKTEWLKLAERAAELADPTAPRDIFGPEKNLITSGVSERAKRGLERLYDLFAKAPWLGSLIDPTRAGGDIFSAEFVQLQPLFGSILKASATDDIAEMAVAAHGIAKAAELLGRRYTLVATNVPYLGRGKQSDILREFCDSNYPKSKADLGACLADRCLNVCALGGSIAIVAPQTWLYLGPYKNFRIELLQTKNWNFVSWLGPKAFQTAMWDFNVVLLSITNSQPLHANKMSGWDASDGSDPGSVEEIIVTAASKTLEQSSNLKNPDARVLFNAAQQVNSLGEYATSLKGIATGDLLRFVCKFWEFPKIENGWEALQGSVQSNTFYGGRRSVVMWEEGKGRLFRFVAERLGETGTGAWLRGEAAWGKKGVAIAQISSLSATLYSGDLFDENTAAIIPHNENDLAALWFYCSSSEFREEVRKLDDSMKVPTLTLLKVPFQRERWRDFARKALPNGLGAPFTFELDQWIFTGRPLGSSSPLHVAVVRLLGYLWPRQTGSSFNDCPSVERDGLEKHADEDGIVCLISTKGKPPAEQRLNALLADAFGLQWSAAKLVGLLAEVGFAGKTLDDWLRDGFFAQHCELFHHRPFIWHMWDGRRDGFHALVNYHRLAGPDAEGLRTLDKLIYTYLGAWIERQELDQKAGVEGADGRLAAAQHLKSELEKIRKGEPPFDIFVRWKSLADQPKGWNPDINVGVRINSRPFMTARPFGAKAKNTCILRSTPRISWDKDRGKEPHRSKDEFPWFWKWDGETKDFAGGKEFDGARWNDLHYSLSAKEKAGQEKGAA
jgi:hypothetical protein